MPSPSRPRKPARRFPNIVARFTGGRWLWRAAIRDDGRLHTGRYRDTQEAAYEDSRTLRARAGSLPRKVVTLDDALRAVIASKRAQGASEAYLTRQLECNRRSFLRYLEAGTPMHEITVEQVEWYVAEARRRGRSERTIVEKDLPLLALAFAAAGLESPVGQIRNRPRRIKRRPMDYYTPAEFAAVVRRMRSESYVNARGGIIVVTARERHADIVELLGLAGIRAGELERLTVDDVDLRRGMLLVSDEKSKQIRPVVLVGRLHAVADRLVAEARRLHRVGRNPQLRLVPGGMNTLAEIWRKWRRRLGVDGPTGRRLRHTFITGILHTGGAPADAQSLAGHRRMSTTDRYVHEVTHRRESAAEALAREAFPEEPERANGQDPKSP